MHKLRCWLDHRTTCAWPCCCCANQLQQLYNLIHSVHSIVDCSAACNANDERKIVGHFSDLVSMTCQMMASAQVLGSPQTVSALLVLMTALADARFHAIHAKTCRECCKSFVVFFAALQCFLFGECSLSAAFNRAFLSNGMPSLLLFFDLSRGAFIAVQLTLVCRGIDHFGSDSDTGSRMLWLVSKLCPC